MGIQKDAAYNLSHSGEYVLCSVHEGKDPKIRVGCDIEEIGICNMKIARRFFCRSEYEKIDSETNEERRRELFFRYWVLKESFIKATREGMAMGWIRLRSHWVRTEIRRCCWNVRALPGAFLLYGIGNRRSKVPDRGLLDGRGDRSEDKSDGVV